MNITFTHVGYYPRCFLIHKVKAGVQFEEINIFSTFLFLNKLSPVKTNSSEYEIITI